MFSKLFQGCSYTASFLLSAFSTDTWMTIAVGAIGVALLALMIGGFILNTAVASTNILIAACVLALFTVPLGLGIYFLNKDKFTSNSEVEEKPSDSSWFTLPYLSNFGLPQ